MVQGVSFSNFSIGFNGNTKRKSENPPEKFLAELKQAGIPEDVISQGKVAVEAYAKENNITLPAPPEPPKGKIAQGTQKANENSIFKTDTSDEVKQIMADNGIASTGVLKDDLEAIKTTVKSLDKYDAEVLKSKLKLAGLNCCDEVTDKKHFKGLDQLGEINKHFLVNKKTKSA